MKVDILTFLNILLGLASAKVRILLGDGYEDCSTGGKAKFLDYSGLEYEYTTDTDFFIKGDFKFLQEVKSPLKCKLFMEKLERGKWIIAIINRKVDDICPYLQSPTEPWYDFFSKFKKKNCPFPAGHVETFSNYSVHCPDFIPRNLIGQYRATTSFEFVVDDEVHFDCVRLSLDIVDS